MTRAPSARILAGVLACLAAGFGALSASAAGDAKQRLFKRVFGDAARLDPQIVQRVGPAVEINTLLAHDDGRLTVSIRANDRSGIEQVVLSCDGQPRPAKTAPPYTWEWKPGAGGHTLEAQATDVSSHHNTRRSFRRTLAVP